MARKTTKKTPTKPRSLTRKPSFLGDWDIIESEDMDDELFFTGPSEISFETKGNRGHLDVAGMSVELDWREGERPRSVEFTFEGGDEEEEDFVHGRGKAWVDDGGHLLITIWHHGWDSYSFIAERKE